MSENLIFDQRTGGWMRGSIDQSGTVQLTTGTEPKEPTVATVYLSSCIRIADSADTGILDDHFVRELEAVGPVDQLRVVIDSSGGHCLAMGRIAEAITTHPAKEVITICTCKAFSAAMFIFLCGHRRYMAPGAALMCHRAHANGDTRGILAQTYSSIIVDIITERANVDRATVQAWVDTETYFDCATALRYGLATNIDLDSLPNLAVDFARSNLTTPEQAVRMSADREFEAIAQRVMDRDARIAKKGVPIPPKVPRPIKHTDSPNLVARDEWQELYRLRGDAFFDVSGTLQRSCRAIAG